MCQAEWQVFNQQIPASAPVPDPLIAFSFGDQHRGCGHYVRVYYSGETKDCEQPNCRLSSRHAHGGSRTCGCRDYYDDYRRVVNIYQTRCDDCIRKGLPGRQQT